MKTFSSGIKCNKGNANAVLLEQYIERLKQKDNRQKDLKRKAILEANGPKFKCEHSHARSYYEPDHFLGHALRDIKNFERDYFKETTSHPSKLKEYDKNPNALFPIEV